MLKSATMFANLLISSSVLAGFASKLCFKYCTGITEAFLWDGHGLGLILSSSISNVLKWSSWTQRPGLLGKEKMRSRHISRAIEAFFLPLPPHLHTPPKVFPYPHFQNFDTSLPDAPPLKVQPSVFSQGLSLKIPPPHSHAEVFVPPWHSVQSSLMPHMLWCQDHLFPCRSQWCCECQ